MLQPSLHPRHRLVFVLAVLLTACQPKAIPMTPEEQQRIEALTANMTTRCVGRYLVNMPERFVLNSESTTVIEGVKVAVRPMGKRHFELALEAKQTELGRTRFRGSEQQLPYVRSSTPLPSRWQGFAIDRARSVDTGRLARALEIFGWLDGYLITAYVESRDNTFPEDANDGIAKQLGNNTPEKLAHLLKVFDRVSGRKDTEVPTAPGLCIPNGFVAGAERKGQETDAVYHLVDAPDVWFGFGSSDAIKEKTTLFDRTPDVERAMKDGGSKTLRKDKRILHGQTYEEWLFINTPEQDDVRGGNFLMHGNELRTDPAQPFIEFKLHNGNRIPVPDLTMVEKDRLGLFKPLPKATLSDAEALALWDKVSATLRPRPGAF